jgi:hypothetical protein
MPYMKRRSLQAKDSDNSNYDMRTSQRCCWKLKPTGTLGTARPWRWSQCSSEPLERQYQLLTGTVQHTIKRYYSIHTELTLHYQDRMFNVDKTKASHPNCLKPVISNQLRRTLTRWYFNNTVPFLGNAPVNGASTKMLHVHTSIRT